VKNKLRSVNTKFWDDPFVRKLNKNEKLIFLYLLSNPLTNVAGIYEITFDRILFDTGVRKETLSKAFEVYKNYKKVYHFNDYIILPNFIKNQSMNLNMKIGVKNIVDNLPPDISNYIFNDLSNACEGFTSLLKALININIEREREIERKKKEKKKSQKSFEGY